MTPDQGIPGWFVAFFALAIVVGVGSFLWRLSVALQALKDKSLITQAEYDTRRAEILGSI